MGPFAFMTVGNWIALGTLIVLIMIPVVTALMSHIRHDEQRDARLTRVEEEMGTRVSGLRGAVHEHTNALTWLGGCVWYLANKLGIELPRREK